MSREFRELEGFLKFVSAMMTDTMTMEQQMQEAEKQSEKNHEEVLKEVKFTGVKEDIGYDSVITADIIADALEIHKKVYDLKKKVLKTKDSDKFTKDLEGYASVQFIRFVELLSEVEETTLALAHTHIYDKETIDEQCKEKGVKPLELAMMLMLDCISNM